MTSTMKKNQAILEDLKTVLLSTLDESIFFAKLASATNQKIQAEEVLVNLVREEGNLQLISRNSTELDAIQTSEGHNVARQVLKTKRAYFSNNVSRDPIFNDLHPTNWL